MHYLFEQSPAWDVFSFTLVDGSKSADLIAELVKQAGYQLEKVYRQESPFIRLAGTWQNYFASLPKKFRWLLRDAEKKLKASGELRYSEYSKGSELEHFLTAMFQIEQKSWKEEQGSSITANERQREFYTTLTAIAAQQGLLSCHLLELNREPIAYIYGLLFNGVFSDLKESYDLAYQSMSPGHALKLFALQRLHERGVRLYDYMGVCEPYKMRWTDKTYVRSTYIIYNKTLPALAARTSGMLINYSRSLRERFHRAACVMNPLGGKSELRRGH
jgi:CelD/BcsL family acetyltransferase involved in cellulose biosynthesis